MMASVVSGWVDPWLPEAGRQNEATGAALAVGAMSWARYGYATIVDGYLFPDGVAGLAHACRGRHLSCHYVVLTADEGTCWRRASGRAEGRWPLEQGPVAQLYARFASCGVDETHVVDASGEPDEVATSILASFRDGSLAVAETPKTTS